MLQKILDRIATRRRLRAVVLAVTLLFVLSAAPARARADEKTSARVATFALIIGSNQSVDANLPSLRYADDDAARYLDLFRLLGARTYLLTRLDDNTRRLHPQAVAEAMEPRKTSFDVAVAQLILDVTQASERGVETLVYFVYAGHGNVQNGEGYITLEDLRITGTDLARIFARVPATRIHVIADACGSYFLAYSRGPGGERRPIDFTLASPLATDARIGLLLSTSSARESHEWEAFQAGVFSHEVRSGLYGAADADGDGVVSYREIAAFVTRANAKVPNERYRPDVHSRAPRAGGDALLDLRHARGRRVEIDGKHAGHYFLEDARGVRIADLHNAPGQTLSLVRPTPNGRTFLRNVDADTEYLLERAAAEEAPSDVVALADLTGEAPRTASRGAAHESFSTLFAAPFDRQAVDDYREQAIDAAPAPAPAPKRSSLRMPIGVGALLTGAGLAGAGAVIAIGTSSLGGAPALNASQASVASRNERIESRNTASTVLYASGAVLAATGFAILLWPESRAKVTANVSANGGSLGYGGTF